jgi:hypothetical protein
METPDVNVGPTKGIAEYGWDHIDAGGFLSSSIAGVGPAFRPGVYLQKKYAVIAHPTTMTNVLT